MFTVPFSHTETLPYQQFCALLPFITFADPMSLKTKHYPWLEIGRFRSTLFIFVFKASSAVQKCYIQEGFELFEFVHYWNVRDRESVLHVSEVKLTFTYYTAVITHHNSSQPDLPLVSLQ